MKTKLSIQEKILLIGPLLILIAGIIIRAITACKDIGILVALSFFGIILYVIFAVSAFFPADWRMTEKQKAKIPDMDKYQKKYRVIILSFNLLVALIFTALILTIT